MSTEAPTPLEAALDLLVYIPVGFAVTVGEEIPKLAAKGRARLGGRISAARMIGQFAVAQGRREVDRRINGAAPAAGPAGKAPFSPRPAAAPRPAPAPGVTPTVVRDAAAPTGTPASSSAPAKAAPAKAAPTRAVPSMPADVPTLGPAVAVGSPPAAADTPPAEAPDVASLAIPGYASLSASQVVQRLAGLSAAELEAVRLYEASSRGRRTILARVTQLQPR